MADTVAAPNEPFLHTTGIYVTTITAGPDSVYISKDGSFGQAKTTLFSLEKPLKN